LRGWTRLGCRVADRRVGEEGDVDAHAEGDRQVVSCEPLITGVETDLPDIEAGARVLARIGEGVPIPARETGLEGVEIGEHVGSEAVPDL